MATVNVSANLDFNPRQVERDAQRALSKVKLKLDDRGFTQPLGRITSASSEFQKSLEASNARVVAFAASAGILYKLSQAFDFLLKSTINVEKQLKDINVILGASSKTLKSFGGELFNVAAATGKSFKEVSDAAGEFARQGLSMEKTILRTKNAMILSRLAMMDSTDAATALTAAVNSFSSAALNSTQIVNKLAAVDAAFAISSQDLAEAIKRSGASAQAAGVNFDELLAVVTAVQERTARGGAVIGNSLKTIFTRIQRPEVLNQLHQLNISVSDLHGNTRPAVEIIKQLASKFNSLSDAQKSVNAELLGGVFQVNNLRALLDDLSSSYTQFDKAQKIASSATNEAQRRNKELNDTLAAQVNALNARAEAAASGLGELTLKPVIKSGISIMDAVLGSPRGLGDEDKAAGVGETIGRGLMSGLGKFLAGPGVLIAATLIGKLLFQFTKFTSEALREIGKIGASTQGIKATEQQLNAVLKDNLSIVKQIESGTLSRVKAEAMIIAEMEKQAALQRNILSSSRIMAPGVSSAARSIPKRSSGHIPSFSHGFVPAGAAAGEIAGAFASGYTPGRVRSTNISGIGKVVYNSKEKVKHYPGLSQPAIIPPASSKAGVRYSRDFKKVHGFTPANAGSVPPNPFGKLTSQRMLDDLNKIRLTDVTRMNVGQKQQAGFMRGIPTATGPTETNPSGMRQVVVNKQITAQLEKTYSNMLKAVESGRMSVQRETKIRELVMKKYQLNDKSLALLDQAYKNEKRSVLSKVEANNKAVEAQQKITNEEQMIAQQAEDARATRAQQRAMAVAFLAPMVAGMASENINRYAFSEDTGANAQNRKRTDATANFLGNTASMAATGFMMGFGPKGAIAGGALGAATSIGPMMDSFSSSLPMMSKNLELASEELQKVTTASQKFAKGISQLENAFSGRMGDESATEVIRTILSAFTDLLESSNPQAAKKLTEASKNLVLLQSQGKSGEAKKVQDEIFNDLLPEAQKAGAQKVANKQLLANAAAFAATPNQETASTYLKSVLAAPSNIEGKNVQEAFMQANQARTPEEILKLLTGNRPTSSAAVGPLGNDFNFAEFFKFMDPSMMKKLRSESDTSGVAPSTAGYDAVHDAAGMFPPTFFLKGFIGDFIANLTMEQIEAIKPVIEKIFDPDTGVVGPARILEDGKKNAESMEQMLASEMSAKVKDINDSFQEFVNAKLDSLQMASNILLVSGAKFEGQSAGTIGVANMTRSSRTVARLQKAQAFHRAKINKDSGMTKLARELFDLQRGGAGKVADFLGPFVRDESDIASIKPSGGIKDQRKTFSDLRAGMLTLMTNNNLERDPSKPGFAGSRAETIKSMQTSLTNMGQTKLANNLAAHEEKIFQSLLNIQRKSEDVNAKEMAAQEKASQEYINSLNKIRLENEKTFGGGIEGFMSGPSAISRGMTFAGNQGAMTGRAVTSRRKGQAALQNLEAMAEISRITAGGVTPDPKAQNILRDSLVSHYDQMTRGMGMQFTKGDLSKIAQSQIDQRLKPDDADLEIPIMESINDSNVLILKTIKEGLGIKDESIGKFANRVALAMKNVNEGKDPGQGGGGGGTSLPPHSLDASVSFSSDIRNKAKRGTLSFPSSINTKTVNARPSILKAGAEGFFTGGIEDKDFHSQISNFGGLMSELGQDLRVGFKGALKEAIFEAESFSDALRSMAVSILDILADKIFSKSFDALFNAIGAYATRGAKGGYVGANGIQRFAEGGMVRGGSGFRDDVPAMLSRGEFVVRRSAVDKYGSGFLNTLNMQGGGATLSASNRIIANDASRPTDFKYAFSRNLSSLALTDESRPDVKRRRDLADKIFRNRAQHTAAMNAYKQQQRGRLIQAYTSAAMQFAAYGMTHGQGTGSTGPTGDTGPQGIDGAPFDPRLNLGGSVRSYASGGYVDDVPAMLMGGEMVMNRDAVNKHGRGFFEKLNRGSLDEEIGFSRGGMVGGYSTGGSSGSSSSVVQLFDRLITSNESLASVIEESNKSGGAAGTASSANNNVTININVDKSGVKSDANASSSSSSESSTSSGGMKSDEEKASSMAEEIRVACLDVIINEKRPGGALSDFGIAGR